jgi:hypothetical protein
MSNLTATRPSFLAPFMPAPVAPAAAHQRASTLYPYSESRAEAFAPAAPQPVRPLLARTGQFIASTPMLAAYIGNLIVREQHEQYIQETVKWALAMFNASAMSGGRISRSIDEIGIRVSKTITKRVGDNEIDLKTAMEAVHAELATVFGKQLRITGWLPGHKVAEGRTVLELSGNPCPSCTVNPTGYKVGDKKNTARCLNSEDCGWTSA